MDFRLEVNCKYCKKSYDIFCNKKDYEKWKNGEGYIQDILNYLSADQRELLISGICGKCFDKIFSYTEDEDE